MSQTLKIEELNTRQGTLVQLDEKTVQRYVDDFDTGRDVPPVSIDTERNVRGRLSQAGRCETSGSENNRGRSAHHDPVRSSRQERNCRCHQPGREGAYKKRQGRGSP